MSSSRFFYPSPTPSHTKSPTRNAGSSTSQSTILPYNNRLYNVVRRENGVFYSLKNHKRKNIDRMKIAMDDVPVSELKFPSLWTADMDEKFGFHNLANGPAYMSVNGKDILVAQYFSPNANRESGLFEKMTTIRDHFLNANIQKEMRDVQISGHHAKRGDAFDGSLSVQPTGVGIQLGRLAKEMPSNAPILKEIATLAAKLILQANPDIADRNGVLLRHWAKNASITFGDEDNYGVSSFQVNCHGLDPAQKVEQPAMDLKNKIGAKGDFHTDGNDETVRYSVAFFLSGPPPEDKWYEGKFVIAPQRIYCEAATFGALVFSAKYAHKAMGYGWYASDLPADLKYRSDVPIPAVPAGLPCGRVCIPVYPRNGLMRPKKIALRFLNDDYTFNEDVLSGVFGTLRNQQEWLMRFKIRERAQNDYRTAQEWCDTNAWLEDGQQQTPRLWIAEMCLSDDPTLEAEYLKLTNDIKSVGCGNMMPAAREKTQQKKQEKIALRGRAWRKISGEVKMQCQHIRPSKSRGKGNLRCKKGVYPSEWNGLCMRHFKEMKDSLRQQEQMPVQDDGWENVNDEEDYEAYV